MIKFEEIKITTDFIKLDSLLKLSQMVMSGGEAKELILNGNVSVNGEICFQRGKKLYDGFVVELGETKLLVKHEGQ